MEGQDAAGNNITHNETESSRSVYDNLVNEKKLVEFVKNNTKDGNLKYEFTADEEDGGLKAIMYHNGGNSVISDGSNVQGTGAALEITSDLAEKLRLVVCTGDVVIERVCQLPEQEQNGALPGHHLLRGRKRRRSC